MTAALTAPKSASDFVSAAFVDPDAAARAIGALEDHGIAARQISVATAASQSAGANDGESADTFLSSAQAHATPVYRDKDGFLEVQTDDPPTPTDMNAVTDARRGGSSTLASPDIPVAAEGERTLTTTTAADAQAGAAGGGLAGLGIGILAGVAALTVPGVGLVLAAGPLWAALAGAVGATAAGAAAGGVFGYLCDLGVGEKHAQHHHHHLTAGSVIVSVHLDANDAPATVLRLLEKYGGQDVAEPMTQTVAPGE